MTAEKKRNVERATAITGGGDDPAVGRAAFIRAATRLKRVPLVPEIVLHQADEATALWEMTEDTLGATGLPPPFWAFPWAGGQGLARYVLDHPEVVRGRTVLDLGAGSGLVAIAAALAGAAHVVANDIDPFAASAMLLNAEANGVMVEVLAGDITGQASRWPVVLAADIAYERDMATRLRDWLHRLAMDGATVLVGDPGRTYLDQTRLEAVAGYDAPVSRELEDAEVKRTSVWRFRVECHTPTDAH